MGWMCVLALHNIFHFLQFWNPVSTTHTKQRGKTTWLAQVLRSVPTGVVSGTWGSSSRRAIIDRALHAGHCDPVIFYDCVRCTYCNTILHRIIR